MTNAPIRLAACTNRSSDSLVKMFADIDRDAAQAVAAELGGMAAVTDVRAELAVRELVERDANPSPLLAAVTSARRPRSWVSTCQ